MCYFQHRFFRKSASFSPNMPRMWKGYLAVVGGIIVHLSLGTTYTFGNLTSYLTSYIRELSYPHDLNYQTAEWIFAMAGMGQGMSMFLGGAIFRKFGARVAAFLGCALMSGGVLLTSVTIKHSFLLTLLTYGIMFGLGVGMAYAPCLANSMKWFPDHKGLVNGLVVAGFGGGAFIFNQVQTAYINPHNLPVNSARYFTEKKLLERVPSCFLVLGGSYVAMQFVGILILFAPPEAHSRRASIQEDESALLPEDRSDSDVDYKKKMAPNIARDYYPKQMIRSKYFYILWFIFLLNGQAVIFSSSLYKAYGQTFIKDDQFLAIVGAFAAVFNAGGRIFWGVIADKFSFKTAMLCLCTSMCALMMTFIIAPLGGKVMFFIWVCLIFGTFSGNFSLFPTATAKAFGAKHVAVNYGLLFTSQVIAPPLGAFLTQQLLHLIGWFYMFCIVAGCSFISLILTLMFNVKTREGKDI